MMKENKEHANSDPRVVDGKPTKGLFISMLVKDITLKDAIGDLVDNSVDGAKKWAGDKKNLKDFTINLTINKDFFQISDNCGGIEAKTARDYAFRFGRPEEIPPTPDSVGQFGIGMKRAFFKVGNKITVESIAKGSRFKLGIDVPTWKDKKGPDNWNFEFDTVGENETNDGKKTKTDITIKSLNQEASDSFDNEKYLEELTKEISLEQTLNLEKGLNIKINGISLKPENLTLKCNDDLKPCYWQYKFDTGLEVEVMAGISTQTGSQGGWYIFCNDRLIMGHDTSKATGWGREEGEDGVALYHQQYYWFRGYVFFHATDSSKLPWNTTKTGMNLDSPAYKTVKTQMVEMMKQVMSLMNRIKKEKEKDNPQKNQVLNNKINVAKAIRITEVLENKADLDETFHFPPEIGIVSEPDTIPISYKVSKGKYSLVKKQLNINKSSEIGLKTFDYYFDNEIGH